MTPMYKVTTTGTKSHVRGICAKALKNIHTLFGNRYVVVVSKVSKVYWAVSDHDDTSIIMVTNELRAALCK